MSVLDYNRSNDIELICSDIVSMKVVYGDIQKDTLIYINYIDTAPIPSKVYITFPNVNPQESKFKSGDKVKIIKDYIMDIKREIINFKDFEGFINDVIFNSFTFEYDYTIAINGRTTGLINESDLELIEQSKKIEYRKDLYDIADDIDGCLLPDFQPKTELIQKKDFLN